MNEPDILAATGPVVNAFEQLGTRYCIGGSIASSAYGIARSTMDVDIVADVQQKDARPFAAMLASAYYVDEKMIVDAIRRRSSFNIIHLATMLKVDVFILRDTAYAKEVLRRARKDTLDEEQTDEFYLVSPEDIILEKLRWFRSGGEVSDRQWHDVLGVIAVQQAHLDRHYLETWAAEIGISDLLEKAFGDAETGR